MRLPALGLITATAISACARAHEIVPPPAPPVASTPPPDAGSPAPKSDEDVALERILEFDAGPYNVDDAMRALDVTRINARGPRLVGKPLAGCLPTGKQQPSARACHDADEYSHDTKRPPDGSRLRLRGKLAAYLRQPFEKRPRDPVYLGHNFNIVSWSTGGLVGCEGEARVEVEATVDYSQHREFGLDDDTGTIPLTDVRIVAVFDTDAGVTCAPRSR